MKKLLLILLCLPMIGFGQTLIPAANSKAYLGAWQIVLFCVFVLQAIIGVLILQAGQRLNSGRLQAAGFLWIIAQSTLVFMLFAFLDESLITSP